MSTRGTLVVVAFPILDTAWFAGLTSHRYATWPADIWDVFPGFHNLVGPADERRLGADPAFPHDDRFYVANRAVRLQLGKSPRVLYRRLFGSARRPIRRLEIGLHFEDAHDLKDIVERVLKIQARGHPRGGASSYVPMPALARPLEAVLRASRGDDVPSMRVGRPVITFTSAREHPPHDGDAWRILDPGRPRDEPDVRTKFLRAPGNARVELWSFHGGRHARRRSYRVVVLGLHARIEVLRQTLNLDRDGLLPPETYSRSLIQFLERETSFLERPSYAGVELSALRDFMLAIEGESDRIPLARARAEVSARMASLPARVRGKVDRFAASMDHGERERARQEHAHAEQALQAWLVASFSAQELKRFASTRLPEAAHDVAWGAPLSTLAFEFVRVLARRNAIDERFFQSLSEVRDQRRDEIAVLRAGFLDEPSEP